MDSDRSDLAPLLFSLLPAQIHSSPRSTYTWRIIWTWTGRYGLEDSRVRGQHILFVQGICLGGERKKLSFHRYSHSWWNGGLVHPIFVSYWTMDIAKLRIASSRVPFMYRLVTEKFTLAWVLSWSPSLLRYSMKAVSADLGWRKYFCCRW